MWPSGKAPGFGPGIRGFESLHPSQEKCLRSFDLRHFSILRRGFELPLLYKQTRTYRNIFNLAGAKRIF